MHTVAAVGIGARGEARISGGGGIIGFLVQAPVEAVAAVNPSGVVARFIDGDGQVDGAIIASAHTVVEEECVPNGALTEDLGGVATSGTNVEHDAVAAGHSSIFGVGTGGFDGEVEGIECHTMGSGIGVANSIDASSGEGLTSPSSGSASFIAGRVSDIDNDVEVELVDGVA